MPLRLLQQLDRHAAERSDLPAIAHASPELSGGDVTWSQLAAAVNRLAEELSRNLSAGDILMLCAPNRAEFTVAFLAGFLAGLRVFPVSPSLTPAELQAAARQSNAGGIIGS